MIFQPFPKLARLARECVITEKLDGTNAQVIIIDPEASEPELYEATQNVEPLEIVDGLYVYAGSRTRLITPGKTSDNYGFAGWVHQHAEQLVQLGEGRHFGEWYGQGIQRNYGLNERRFALFDTSKFVAGEPSATQEFDGRVRVPNCCSVVPVLYRGPFDTNTIKHELGCLKATGSAAVPGWYDPEGIVVWHTHAHVAFKITYDDKHKDAA